MRLGDHDLIGNQIVDKIAARGSRKSQVTRLYRCRFQGKNTDTVTLHEPDEINQNIDAVATDHIGGFTVIQIDQVDETIAARFDSPAIDAAIIFAIGIDMHLESFSIMQAEQPMDQVGGGMIAEIIGEVTDSDFIFFMRGRVFFANRRRWFFLKRIHL